MHFSIGRIFIFWHDVKNGKILIFIRLILDHVLSRYWSHWFNKYRENQIIIIFLVRKQRNLSYRCRDLKSNSYFWFYIFKFLEILMISRECNLYFFLLRDNNKKKACWTKNDFLKKHVYRNRITKSNKGRSLVNFYWIERQGKAMLVLALCARVACPTRWHNVIC